MSVSDSSTCHRAHLLAIICPDQVIFIANPKLLLISSMNINDVGEMKTWDGAAMAPQTHWEQVGGWVDDWVGGWMIGVVGGWWVGGHLGAEWSRLL